MDVLRTGVSAGAKILIRNFPDEGTESNISKAVRLLARFLYSAFAARYRITRIATLVDPNPELSFSANLLLYMINGKEPSPAHERALDVSADPLCGARVQRVDVYRPSRSLDAVRYLFGDLGSDRRAQRGRCMAGPTSA